MKRNHSIQFFDTQFQKQKRERDFQLNPFELAALPHLRGRVVDFGCGMGNLAFAAAERGCTVLALDASSEAIAHIRERAREQKLPVDAVLADLEDFKLDGEFDTVVSIGLLMFFDRKTALKALGQLKEHLRAGGVAVVNVLIEGTTYLDMFDPDSYCLFSQAELESNFAGWSILRSELSNFEAPGGRNKAFITIIALKPSFDREAGR